MSRNSKRIWSIVRLVILAFLIVGTIDLISIGSDTFRRHASQSGLKFAGLSDLLKTKDVNPRPQKNPYDSLTDSPALHLQVIDYKRLHIDVDPNRVAVSYDVYLPKNHPLLTHAEQDWSREGAKRISDEILGPVYVIHEPLKFEQIKTSFDETDKNAHLYVNAAPHQSPGGNYAIRVIDKQRGLPLNFASKEVIVHTRGVNVRSGYPVNPVSKNDEVSRYILPADRDVLDLWIETDSTVTSQHLTRDSLAVLLQKETNIPGLNYVLIGLLEAIPFIIFLVWCGRNATAIPDAGLQRRVVETYLVFHFSYFFCYALNTLIADWRNPFVLALNYFDQHKLSVFAALGYINTTYILLPMMAMFIFAWPKIAREWTESQQDLNYSSC